MAQRAVAIDPTATDHSSMRARTQSPMNCIICGKPDAAKSCDCCRNAWCASCLVIHKRSSAISCIRCQWVASIRGGETAERVEFLTKLGIDHAAKCPQRTAP